MKKDEMKQFHHYAEQGFLRCVQNDRTGDPGGTDARRRIHSSSFSASFQPAQTPTMLPTLLIAKHQPKPQPKKSGSAQPT